MTQYNHRIVPDGVRVSNPYKEKGKKYDEGFSDGVAIMIGYSIPCPSEWTAEEAVEILKISKDDWNEIVHWYVWNKAYVRDGKFIEEDFAPILSMLIHTAPLKGLSKEEIRKLHETTIA
ncbi:MAG: hypothetical protein PHI12_08775 [Dehalococcoidales bacterium]|nr:hypothetical protein [Dehalococcoidales bacterium]